MQAPEIIAALRALAEEAGPKAYASIVITADPRNAIHISLSPKGLLDDHRVTADADSFEEAFARLRATLEADKARMDKRRIRQMALAIIEISLDQGACSDAALRGTGFSILQIKRHGPDACEEAGRLAAGGPFRIVRTRGANAEVEP